MPRRRRSEPPPSDASASALDDATLVASLSAGRTEALPPLMDRYDRLVRFTIFRVSKDRCAADPQWLDAVASNTWTGFLHSVQDHPDRPPKSVRSYLVAIARNSAVSALRSIAKTHGIGTGNLDEVADFLRSDVAEPSDIVSSFEQMAALRGCVAELPAMDQAISRQLPAIMERRWKEAGEALGMSESTLRSKWKVILQTLQSCMKRKTGLDFAPKGSSGD